MKKLLKGIAIMLSISFLLLGCTSGRNPIGNGTVMANPNNVYRFSENTSLNVLIQDVKTGEWKTYDKKILFPVGWYIGSGIE